MKETVIQSAVLRLLRIHPKVAWIQRINTGAARLKGFHVRFGFPGCSDLIGQMSDGRFLAIECKTDTGITSDVQAAFLERVSRHGGVAGIVRSVEDADHLVRAA